MESQAVSEKEPRLLPIVKLHGISPSHHRFRSGLTGSTVMTWPTISYALLVFVYEGTVKTTENSGFWSESLLTPDDPNDRMRYCIGKYRAGELRIIQVHE